MIFQSTHPERGGTCGGQYLRLGAQDFNPPTPSGVGPGNHAVLHADLRFQSTHPERGGTGTFAAVAAVRVISIHPPRAGWDTIYLKKDIQVDKISIHPPRAGWDWMSSWSCGAESFQSTHPERGGTLAERFRAAVCPISIHPPRAGWDCMRRGRNRLQSYFNPPTPSGVGHDRTRKRNQQRDNFNPPTLSGVGPRSRRASPPPRNFNPPTPSGVGPLAVRLRKIRI